ncbi:TadE/TadG family type IV pilus assembly protein [Streptomyces gardneri]|uniref:Septum formation initiator n=1 Tax=Streptomyces gardneri TaxID=66892 RepID=A0A4Y3RUK9_9ACTN|nr:TadE/TadG family type IV pilus assembly protein [Streptomyces gardneri]GEB61396.1 septum formation initiator [Streptomyces gardneri]GHG87122.1 septum formation initiator [Streptomyces gardneri]
MTRFLRARTRDRGQAAIEYLGFLPILLIVGLAGLQLGVAAYAAQQAGTAARAAARAATTDANADNPVAAGNAAGRAAADWVTSVDVAADGGEAVARVSVRIPQVVPFWSFDDVTKTATMPMPDEEDLP